jgi:hypothetical protein
MSGLVRKSALTGANSVFRSGAPWSMKMGNIVSPWRYDAVARHALQWAKLRRTAILRYASRAAVYPISPAWSGYPSFAAAPTNPGIDVMGQDRKVSVLTERTDT